ncbi:hypothetical protein [Treponema lecithinolyticum]
MEDIVTGLPVHPDTSAQPPRLLPVQQPPVSVIDIRNFISPKLYTELSWDEKRSADDVTQDCIDKALTVAEVLLEMVDQKLNLYSRTQQEIVKLLTVSKLYEYNGDKVGTKEFLQRAEKMISDRYRSVEKERESVLPFVTVAKSKKEESRLCK